MLAQTTRTCRPVNSTFRARQTSVRVMAVKMGDTIPFDKTVTIMKKDAKNPDTVALGDLFKGKKAVLFGLPGAYTGVCSSKHVPEYKSKFSELQQAGVEMIACISVNDAWVMRKWAEDMGVSTEEIHMLADGDASVHQALGLTQRLDGLGERALRYSMFLDNGVIKVLNVEEPGGLSYKISGPSHMLEDLKALHATAK